MLDMPLRSDPTQDLPPVPGSHSDRVDGYIELCGPLNDNGDWLIGGWARRDWKKETSDAVSLHCTQGALTGTATTCFFKRGDLIDAEVGDDPTGFLLLLRGGGTLQGSLLGVTVRLAGLSLRLAPAGATLPSAGEGLVVTARRLAAEVGAPQAAAFLDFWVDPSSVRGPGSLAKLGRPVRVVVEASFVAASSSLVVMGWLDDPTDIIAGLYIRSGDRTVRLDETNWLRLPGLDVDGGPDPGFLAYLPGLYAPGLPVGLVVEFTDSDIAVEALEPPAPGGLGAVEKMLSAIHLHHTSLSRAMARVVGPAIAALSQGGHGGSPAAVQDFCFGRQPVLPRCSVIVPLDGRADDLEWQLALLSEAAHHDVEFIYVLDDPALTREVERRAETCFARFGLPFRLLRLNRRVGRSRCCNMAADHATGEFLCFLGPGAMPEQAGWLDRLVRTLAMAPGLGAIGARLLDRAPADGASFIEDDSLVDAASLSLACLAIRRAVFNHLGGFDEAYSIACLEDEDLCRRLRRSGLHCAIRPDVAVTLLDRAMEAPPLWRRHLTQYAAWQRQNWRRADTRQHDETWPPVSASWPLALGH